MTTRDPLPNDWTRAPLESVCSLQSGANSITKAAYRLTGFPAYSASGPDGLLDGYEHEGPGVVVSAVGARCGKCFWADGKWTAIANTMVLRPLPDAPVDIEFLFYQVNNEAFWPRSGSAQPFIPRGQARRTLVALPPVAEQRAIASILRTIQQAKEATDQAIVAAQALKGNLLRHLFTYGLGPREPSGDATGIGTDAGTLPSGWAVGTLSDVALSRKGAIVSGPFGSNIGKRFFVEVGIPLIRGNNLTKGTEIFRDGGYVYITAEKAAELANCQAIPGDLVFTAAGTIGQVGVIPETARYPMYVISNKQLRVRLDRGKANPTFLYYWFTHDRMQALFHDRRGGSGVPMINLNVLKSLPIPMPSLSVQQEIAEIARAADRKIRAEEQRRDALVTLFTTLLNDLMSARLRAPLTNLRAAAS